MGGTGSGGEGVCRATVTKGGIFHGGCQPLLRPPSLPSCYPPHPAVRDFPTGHCGGQFREQQLGGDPLGVGQFSSDLGLGGVQGWSSQGPPGGGALLRISQKEMEDTQSGPGLVLDLDPRLGLTLIPG